MSRIEDILPGISTYHLRGIHSNLGDAFEKEWDLEKVLGFIHCAIGLYERELGECIVVRRTLDLSSELRVVWLTEFLGYLRALYNS